jgi:hypothetical protein
MLDHMSATQNSQPADLSVTTADVLGVELARGIRAQADAMSDGVAGFARSHSLDADRLHVELIYLSILTTQFALGVALGESHARVGAAFERALWAADPWRASASGLAARLREYKDAFNHPHPEMGRAYVIGRTFARHCHCSHEVAVIEFGARAYMDQLPPILGLLRSVTVVSAGPAATR